MKLSILAIILLLTSGPCFAEASSDPADSTKSNKGRGEVRERIEPYGFLYGLGFGYNQEIYKGFDTRFTPLPLLGYRGERLRVFGPFISYDIAKHNGFSLSAKLAPRFQNFDESDSSFFSGLEKREFSFDAGLGVRYEKNDWKLDFDMMTDVLAKSNGTESKIKLAKAFRKGPIFIEPSIQVSHLNDNHVNYYYGVSDSESLANRPAYLGESALNKTLGIAISTPIFFEGMTRLDIGYTWNDSSITDSPLVDSDTNLSVRLVYSQFF